MMLVVTETNNFEIGRSFYFFEIKTLQLLDNSLTLALATLANCNRKTILNISQQPKTKCLGIIFHKHLSWKLHMDLVLQKICVSYGTIKKISKHFGKKTLLVLYNSLIISHIRNCITTWHIGNKTTASKIQQIANKFMRLTFGLHHRANITDILQNNNIMTIDQITELEITCFMCI